MTDLNSLEPLDKNWVQERLNKFPFVQIEGVTNARSLGPYSVSQRSGSENEDSTTQEPSQLYTTRPFQLFRSAEVSGITERGKEQMRELGISRVFDLRSTTEMEKYNTPVPHIEDVQVLSVPVFEKEDYSPEVMARRFQLYASGKTEAFMELYTQILDNGGPAFSEILRHVRDRPDEGCLFHCTAGKDRTAVIAAILLSLAGVEDTIIADDYELTRIGREPVREMILHRLSKEPIFATNKDSALNMLTSRRETMLAFLELLQEKYGGVKGYIREICGLTDDDIQIIRQNLITKAGSQVA